MSKYQVPPFLKREGEALLFNKEGEFVFYVPEYYFTCGCAVIEGDYVNILGVMDYAIFDKSGKHSGLKPFRFPTMFLCKPSEIVKMKDIKLTKNTETQDYRFLKFSKGDEVVSSVTTVQDVANVEKFYSLFTGGHLPTTIPYNEIQDLFVDGIELNGNSYGVTTQMFGFIISEICRSTKDISKPYRLGGSKDLLDYQCISIKQVPKYVSPYAALTSENWDEAMVSAVLNKNKTYIPQEKIIMS